MFSVEELLGTGQAKSGSNGVPFTYANPYQSNGLPEVTYYLHDHLGNTRVTYTSGCKTEPGGTPIRELTLVHAADYHPYGSILREWRDGPAEKYLSTHHERDTETGLDYRGARYYDAEVARFLSLDPLAADYASWSTYNYVMGNPISFIDEDGRSCGCPPPCGIIKSNLEGAWNYFAVPAAQARDKAIQGIKEGASSFRNWADGLAAYGYKMVSDYATGSNNSGRQGQPTKSMNVTAIEARANATFGPEQLSPVKVGLAGKWMEQLDEIVSPAGGALQEILNPTPAPLIGPSPLEGLLGSRSTEDSIDITYFKDTVEKSIDGRTWFGGTVKKETRGLPSDTANGLFKGDRHTQISR